MNLKRTRGDLLLRRRKHASAIREEGSAIEFAQKNNSLSVPQVGDHATEERLAKRAELLSQLPASTKVETVLKVEPIESNQEAATALKQVNSTLGNCSVPNESNNALSRNSPSAPFSYNLTVTITFLLFKVFLNPRLIFKVLISKDGKINSPFYFLF